MTLKEFAKLLDGRQYRNEITEKEEALAKELGFVVVFGYSDDCAELRGAIDAELDCFDGGILKHDNLPDEIYADWCPEDIDCSWAYGTSIPHEKFYIWEGEGLYCVGIVLDINTTKPITNADRIRAMTDEDYAKIAANHIPFHSWPDAVRDIYLKNHVSKYGAWLEWLQQPVKEDAESELL